MSEKFDSELFSRNYSKFKKTFQKYIKESQEQGNHFVMEIRVIIADKMGRSTAI
jgi:hypothetical protein